MSKQALNIQDAFLNMARKNAVPLTIIITNGYQIKDAVLKGYDNFVMLVEAGASQHMIYKHAVSSIIPARAIDLNGENTKDDEK